MLATSKLHSDSSQKRKKPSLLFRQAKHQLLRAHRSLLGILAPACAVMPAQLLQAGFQILSTAQRLFQHAHELQQCGMLLSLPLQLAAHALFLADIGNNGPFFHRSSRACRLGWGVSEPGLRRRGHETRCLPLHASSSSSAFYTPVVVNHQHRGLLLCLSTYPGCSVQIVLWGPYWLAPG